MHRPAALAICLAMLLASCEIGPNIIPIRIVYLASANPDADQKKVEEIVENLGFSQRMGTLRVSNMPGTHGGTESAQELGFWYWPEHPSTGFGLLRMLSSNSIVIAFADDRVEGWLLTEPSCTKYLELVAALKARFEPERLTLQTASCRSENSLPP